MSTYFAPHLKRALSVLASTIGREGHCPSFAVALVKGADGQLKAIEFGNLTKSTAVQAKDEILKAAVAAAVILKAEGVLTAYCPAALPSADAPVEGSMIFHFDHFRGYSTSERVPFKRATDGTVEMLPQQTGQPLLLFSQGSRSPPASQPASAASAPSN